MCRRCAPQAGHAQRPASKAGAQPPRGPSRTATCPPRHRCCRLHAEGLATEGQLHQYCHTERLTAAPGQQPACVQPVACTWCSGWKQNQLNSGKGNRLRHCALMSRAPTCELGLEHREALLRLGCACLKLGQGCGVHAAAACGGCGVAAAAMRCGPRRRRRREQAAAEPRRRSYSMACTTHPASYLSVPERAPQGTAEEGSPGVTARVAAAAAACDLQAIGTASGSIAHSCGKVLAPVRSASGSLGLPKTPLRTCGRQLSGGEGVDDCLVAPCTPFLIMPPLLRPPGRWPPNLVPSCPSRLGQLNHHACRGGCFTRATSKEREFGSKLVRRLWGGQSSPGGSVRSAVSDARGGGKREKGFEGAAQSRPLSFSVKGVAAWG